MFQQQVVFGSPSGAMWRFEVAAGILLVGAGVLIAVYPQILVALIAATFILCGLSLIGAGWRMHRSTPPRNATEYEVIDV